MSPDRGTYHCFGCGVGGDAISFVAEIEGLDFVGAIEWLADRFTCRSSTRTRRRQADAQRSAARSAARAARAGGGVLRADALGLAAGALGARSTSTGRGLGEEICSEFRLGLVARRRDARAQGAREGFTARELAAAGLVDRRGGDYFQRRLMFPLADARGRVIGFQARKLREDDPLRGKYVNSPESELFHKSHVLYGLDLARGAIAKQDRAIVVEGNTDVIALRQAGLEPVVASMGTALTERQLKELARLTQRLFLCFDADAAGEDATLRGMELALRAGFDVKVVALPKGKDPADEPAAFEARLADAESYAVHRVRLELDRARDRQHAYLRVQDVLNDRARIARAARGVAARERPARAHRSAARGGGRHRERGRRAVAATRSRRATGSSAARSRGCGAHPELGRVLAELGPEHFDYELHRRARDELLAPSRTPTPSSSSLLAALDARGRAGGHRRGDCEADAAATARAQAAAGARGRRRSATCRTCSRRSQRSGPRSESSPRARLRSRRRPSAVPR